MKKRRNSSRRNHPAPTPEERERVVDLLLAVAERAPGCRVSSAALWTAAHAYDEATTPAGRPLIGRTRFWLTARRSVGLRVTQERGRMVVDGVQLRTPDPLA